MPVCSCPFPSSNPASNKRGLTSVTRAHKSPLHQNEESNRVRYGGQRIGEVAGKFERWESY